LFFNSQCLISNEKMSLAKKNHDKEKSAESDPDVIEVMEWTERDPKAAHMNLTDLFKDVIEKMNTMKRNGIWETLLVKFKVMKIQCLKWKIP
jgi:ABC-type Fe3+-hydroxamate transport system substrate-binding protein